MSAVLGVCGLIVGAVIGYLWAKRIAAARSEQLAQAVRMREDEVRNVRLQLSGLRRAYERGTVSVDVPMQPRDDRVAAVLEEVRSMIAPLAAQAERQAALTHLSFGFANRGHLSGLLDEITRRAGLSAVVLSDAVGLPIADAGTDDGADSGEALAAAAAIVLTLTDRLEQVGQPESLSLVVRDVRGRSVLHRIFDVHNERFVLTGIAESTSLTPDALDATLPQLRHILQKPTAAVA